MIYTKFGSPCTILAYAGKYVPRGRNHHLVLVKIRHEDDGSEGFYHPVFMKADGGAAEIDAAVDAAPEITLTPKEAEAALEQAS